MQQIAHYRVENLLGEGTFASVYRAFDQKFERDVALKILKPVWLSDPEAVGRFKQEAKTMAKLRHPHIVDVYDVGESEGSIYLAQLLVEGETLAARLKRGPLAWSKMLEVLRAVAAALDYAHEQGVVHRDIKPSNIMLDQDGRAYLGDFGLVRAAEGSMVLSTTSGGMIGTPAYMAPEQWEGKGVSTAIDIYALSCVVVEMLTGKLLFDGSTPAVVMRQHLIEGPQLPPEWPEDVPAGMNNVLRRGLAENPADRFSSAGELTAALVKLSVRPRPEETPVEIDEEVPTEPRLKSEAVTLWLVSSEGQSYELKPGSLLTFGRSSQCDIQLDDAQVSREHAELRFDGQHCLVYDKGSANGTFVNERQVGPEGHAFNLGDQLVIGETNFILQAQTPAEEKEEEERSPLAPPPVTEREPEPVVEPLPPAPKRRSTSGLTVVLVGCGALLALVVCLGLAYMFWPQPPSIVENPTSTSTPTPEIVLPTGQPTPTTKATSTSTAPPNKTATAQAAIERTATAAQATTAAQLTEQAARDQQTANEMATAQAAATQTAAARLTEQAMRDQPTTPPQQIFPQTEDFINIPVESGFIAMTWDGNFLWHVNRVGNDGVLHQVSRDGALLGQWTFNGLEFIDGLAFDGSNLWLGNTCCGDTYGLYRVDPGTGNIIEHYLVAPGWGNTNDLTWDGEFLWAASIQPYRLYKLNPADGETISSLPGPIPPDYDGPIPDFDGENNTDLVLRGLTWDGEFLWVSESSTSAVMKIDPNTGAIVSYFIANQQPTTLAWDGTYILIGSFSSSTITRYLP